MSRRLSLVGCLVVAACGGGDGDDPPVDAKQVDSTAAAVVMVSCPATPAATVTTANAQNMYMPNAVTITQGQVVKFTMSSDHNVAPALSMSDPALTVGFGQERCYMFTQPGTFRFLCTPHGFTGMITVN